jgi:hypothetical protein
VIFILFLKKEKKKVENKLAYKGAYAQNMIENFMVQNIFACFICFFFSAVSSFSSAFDGITRRNTLLFKRLAMRGYMQRVTRILG